MQYVVNLLALIGVAAIVAVPFLAIFLLVDWLMLGD